MKNLNIKQIAIGVGMLTGGLLLGWLIFGGNSGQIAHNNHSHESVAEVWTCSMHPQIREDGPGKCPLCGMDLIPVSSTGGQEVSVNEIQMTEAAMKIAAIQTTTVTKSVPQKDVYLPGKVMADERNIATVTAHFNGRVEQLFADFTGQYIKKGQKLATLYSPDLVTAQKELFEALKFKDTNPSFYDAAVQKLKLWELTDSQITEIIEKGEPQFYFNVYAPRSGTILERKVTKGEHVSEGKVLFEVADLNRLWVLFDAYESDLPWVSEGDSISFKIQSIPGQEFKSIVTFIDPVVSSQTRTASVRTEIVNKDSRLKPEMFVEGTVMAGMTGSGNAITIPKSAVLWTGKRAVVYVKLPDFAQPTFQFREIELGTDAGDGYVVLSGLDENEEIATNGVFKIDAAAQLQGKVSMMNPSGGKSSTGHDHDKMNGGMDEFNLPDVNISENTFDVSEEFKEQLRDVFTAYLPVKDALIETDAKNAKRKAKPLLTAISKVDMKLLEGEAHMEWMKDLEVLQSSVEHMLNHKDVEVIRTALSPLSDQLYQSIMKYQVETGGFRQYCPMAFDFEGAFWLSDSEKVLNPYFGDKMLTCGNVEEELK
ncbi:MAG: efflux RND transporter periplasmic adaptor subunit [bacterium]|nr:efflux RND transporter periplasmic adaptor subunit [bacterium]